VIRHSSRRVHPLSQIPARLEQQVLHVDFGTGFSPGSLP
jgi:hypothetical protein